MTSTASEPRWGQMSCVREGLHSSCKLHFTLLNSGIRINYLGHNWLQLQNMEFLWNNKNTSLSRLLSISAFSIKCRATNACMLINKDKIFLSQNFLRHTKIWSNFLHVISNELQSATNSESLGQSWTSNTRIRSILDITRTNQIEMNWNPKQGKHGTVLGQLMLWIQLLPCR